MAEAGTLPLTVIRPSWLFGERDRTTVPRFIREFGLNRVRIVGKGDNPLIRRLRRDRCAGCDPCRRDPGSRGEAYNITSHGLITQKEFLDLFADAFGAPRVRRHVPYWLAYSGDSCWRWAGDHCVRLDRRESRGMGRGFWADTSNTAPRKHGHD